MSALTPEAVLRRFQATVRRHRLWGPADRLLLGISGGPDSVALAALARESGLPVGLAHINYGLRGEESERDEALVRTLADTWDLPLEVSRPDIRALAEDWGQSIQQAARRWRYSWWQELQQREGYSRVLTGHHADDQAETLLLYLLRGGPRAGYQTIPYRRDAICRPLLDLRRQDLLVFLEARELPWREDQSNRQTDYLRNAIRLELLPMMDRITPGIHGRLARLAAQQGALLAAAQHTLLEQRPRFMEQEPEQFRLDLNRLQQEPWSLYALLDWLQPLGFHSSQIRAMDELTTDSTGQRFDAGAWTVIHDRGDLIGRKRGDEALAPILLHASADEGVTPWGRLTLIGPVEVPISWPDPEQEILADGDRLIWPLALRMWEPGDRFVPLGMRGQKKVKALLIDRKRDVFRKHRTLVLCDAEGTILWVVGEQMSDVIRVGPMTRAVYRLRWEASEEGTN